MSQINTPNSVSQATLSAQGALASALASVTRPGAMSKPANQPADTAANDQPAAPKQAKSAEVTYITVDEEKRELTADERAVRKNIAGVYAIYDAAERLIVLADSDKARAAIMAFDGEAKRFMEMRRGKLSPFSTIEGKPVWQLSEDGFNRAIKAREGKSPRAPKVNIGDFTIVSETIKTLKNKDGQVVVTLILRDGNGTLKFPDGRELDVTYATRADVRPNETIEERRKKNPELSIKAFEAQRASRVWKVTTKVTLGSGAEANANVNVFYKVDEILQWAIKPE